jgi:HEAT repeat protein
MRKAAWSALARVASPEALEAFTAAVKDKRDAFVTGLLFDYADRLLDSGRLREADAVLRLRKEAGPLSAMDKCRMLRAHARLGTPESISLIMNGLDETDPKVRGAAFEAAAILPGTEVTRAFTTKMNQSQGQTKIDLLELLGKRGSQMDDRTVMLMYMAMLDRDDTVKIACIRAMQEAGVTSTVPTLLNLIRGPAGPVADAAEQALSRTPGDEVTRQIVGALSTPQGRARLLQVLEVRKDKTALAAVMRFADDSDPQVRAAAYRCLGRLAGEEMYDVFLAAFGGQPGPDVDAAEQAMMRLTSDLITARLLSGYFESSDAQKPSLLRVLARRQLEAIDALLLSETTSPDERTREAAVLGLAMRASPSAAPALLAAAKTGPERITGPAVTGYLNIATAVEKSDPASAASMYVEALKLSVDDQQRKPALQGLGRIADPSSEGLVGLVERLMAEGNVKADAAVALAGLASRMPDSQRARAVELLQKVLNECPEPLAQKSAIAYLRERGVDVDPARAEGFITCWWLLGPVDRGQDRDWDRLPAAMREVDLGRPVTLHGSSLAWKRFHTPDPHGAVDLIQAVGELSGKAVYAYTEVAVEKAEEAVFKIGSDDGIAVWVNGETVHANNVARPLVVDHDVVKVPLRAGKNTIVARIQQGGGEWGFCLRIVGDDGKPLALRQKLQ